MIIKEKQSKRWIVVRMLAQGSMQGKDWPGLVMIVRLGPAVNLLVRRLMTILISSESLGRGRASCVYDLPLVRVETNSF